MGVWSKPLGTVCYGENREILDTTKITMDFYDVLHDDPIYSLSQHNVIVDGVTNFNESIMNTCGSAKIWGYLDNNKINAWTGYFNLLLDQNPQVKEAEAHFYCIDEDHPYIIMMKRGGDLIIREGIHNDQIYSKDHYEDDDSFDMNKYVELLKINPHQLLKETTSYVSSEERFNEWVKDHY